MSVDFANNFAVEMTVDFYKREIWKEMVDIGKIKCKYF